MEEEIWKFNLSTESIQEIEMPQKAQILCIQAQQNNPRIWALVNSKCEMEKRRFEIFATGEEINCQLGIERKYLGTFQIFSDTLVFHVFERLK